MDGAVLRVAPVFGSVTASSGSQNSDAARTVEVIISLDNTLRIEVDLIDTAPCATG